MNKVGIILSAILLLATGVGIYLWWRYSDEQVILRQTDALFQTATVQRLSLGDSDQPLEDFRAIIGDPFTLVGDRPIPAGSYSEDEAVRYLEDFRNSVGGARIRRLETAMSFPTPATARVEALIEVELSWGRGTRSVNKYRAELLFEDTSEGWILTQAGFLQRSGK
jgi:hypothetical protein